MIYFDLAHGAEDNKFWLSWMTHQGKDIFLVIRKESGANHNEYQIIGKKHLRFFAIPGNYCNLRFHNA